jgi:hypothetical protein
VEGGLKAEGRRANMTRLSSVTPLPPPLPAPRICRTACGHVIRISWRETPPPPSTHAPPIAEFEQFSASSAKSEDGLYLGAWKCCSWIWTAFVIMYEFEVKW